MSKQNAAEKTATKQQTKPQPIVEPLAGTAELAGESLSFGVKKATGTQLGDPRFSAIQRQMLAGQIGKTQGNGHLQQVIGNQATHRIGISSRGSLAIQRSLESDLIDSLILSEWQRAANLLNQMNDADLNAQVSQQSPEMLLGVQRAARQANLTRVVQAIQNVQVSTGTQIDRFEGTTFRTPVTLFQSGVIISKDIRFVKRGRFRSNDDFEMLKNRIMDAVRTNLTNRFKLKLETPGGQPQSGDGEYSIRVQFNENPSASFQMQLFGQRHGRSGVLPTSGTIYELGMPSETRESDTTLAHESAHVLLGAHDEYTDAEFPARPIFTDHSLMGDYPNEGETQAELKPRHFGALVQLVGGWFPGRNVSIIQ